MATIQLTLVSQQIAEGFLCQRLSVQITSPDGLIESADLMGLELPEGIDWRKGIVIEGRAPIWLYGYLVHACHPALWVACFDPRLGAVVVATHTHKVSVGQVIPIALAM